MSIVTCNSTLRNGGGVRLSVVSTATLKVLSQIVQFFPFSFHEWISRSNHACFFGPIMAFPPTPR
jgi:hypothetical protein